MKIYIALFPCKVFFQICCSLIPFDPLPTVACDLIKWGQAGPKKAKQDQTEPNGEKGATLGPNRGQIGSNGLGQTGPNMVKWGQTG